MTAPWTSSETTAAIIPAFVKALQTVEDVKKNRKVDAGQMKFSYANLAAVLENTKAVLTANKLAVAQSASDAGVQTILLHEDGEWLAFPPLRIATGQSTPQAQGSALSYGRRYSMLAVLGIATEDDDGKAATQAPKAARNTRPTTAKPDNTTTNTGRPATPNQITRLQIRLKEVGIEKRDDAIATYIAFIGRTVTSSKQMTVAEASLVMDGLDKLDAGLIELVPQDDGSLVVKDAA